MICNAVCAGRHHVRSMPAMVCPIVSWLTGGTTLVQVAHCTLTATHQLSTICTFVDSDFVHPPAGHGELPRLRVGHDRQVEDLPIGPLAPLLGGSQRVSASVQLQR